MKKCNHKYISLITNKKKVMKIIKKNKTLIITKLNIFSKRYFLIYLFNTYVNEFIRIVFSGIKIEYIIYKSVKRRVQSLYKT